MCRERRSTRALGARRPIRSNGVSCRRVHGECRLLGALSGWLVVAVGSAANHGAYGDSKRVITGSGRPAAISAMTGE